MEIERDRERQMARIKVGETERNEDRQRETEKERWPKNMLHIFLPITKKLSFSKTFIFRSKKKESTNIFVTFISTFFLGGGQKFIRSTVSTLSTQKNGGSLKFSCMCGLLYSTSASPVENNLFISTKMKKEKRKYANGDIFRFEKQEQKKVERVYEPCLIFGLSVEK